MSHRRSLTVLLLAVPALCAWLAVPAAEPDVQGLWSQTTPVVEGDPVRFYYFHTGGIGLFRYGKMGLTQTRSFSYVVEGEEITLTVLKTGKVYAVPFTIEDGALSLKVDPMLGGPQTYRKEVATSGHGFKSPQDHPLARMWKHTLTDAHGQERFFMYQLQAPALDGRGVGWYHEGDYMNWSTESLTYRRSGDQLILQFSLRGEDARTGLRIDAEGPHRSLHLSQDPRNFWHPRSYRDTGPGFGVLLDSEPMPYRVPGHHGASQGCEYAK